MASNVFLVVVQRLEMRPVGRVDVVDGVREAGLPLLYRSARVVGVQVRQDHVSNRRGVDTRGCERLVGVDVLDLRTVRGKRAEFAVDEDQARWRLDRKGMDMPRPRVLAVKRPGAALSF